MRLKNRPLLASALGWLLADAAGCANAQQMCAEPAKQTQSPLARAPRNGAQYGGMTIDSGGVSEGAGAPKAAADSGHGVIRIYVILSAPGAGLSVTQRSALAGTLGEIRSTGVLQALLRFYYQSPLTSKANAADSVNKIKADIASAKPTVAEYVDVIPFIQAGFLGPWGEWWGGDLEGGDFGTDQDLRVLKTGTVNALKAAFPSTFIQLRYPRDIATYYADDPQIAFHDDSVLAGDDDGGTFNATKKSPLWPDGDPGKQRAWIKDRSSRLKSVNAGEASESTPDVSCDKLLAYLSEYRIFVFNAQWPAVVTKCTQQLQNQLHWDGPLAPGSAAGSGGGGAGGGGAVDPNFGSELGCWATDQRPWQRCNPASCAADRCRRSASDATCEMYRKAACKGTWPPPGYPGEETAPSNTGIGGSAGEGGASNHGGTATSVAGSTQGGAHSSTAGAGSGAASTPEDPTPNTTFGGGTTSGSAGSSMNGAAAAGTSPTFPTTPGDGC